MTPAQLQEIRERSEAATPGPWETDVDNVYVPKGDLAICADINHIGDSENNANFIAHAREDIPALLAEVERLTTEWDSREISIRGSQAEAFARRMTDVERLTRERDEARQLLQRIVKYAKEDRARTPGLTRLARALEEASALLGNKPEAMP